MKGLTGVVGGLVGPSRIPDDPFEREWRWITDGTGRTWGEFVDAGYR